MSRLPFELGLALRYLRPRRTFVSIITLISVMGVMLGVAVLIIVISVMSGFHHDLQQAILGFSAHLHVTADGKPMRDHEPVASVVRQHPRVKATAPFVVGKVMTETRAGQRGESVDAVLVRGIDPKREAEVSDLPKSIVAGEFNLRNDGLVVGIDWAYNHGVRVGDKVTVFSPNALMEMRNARKEGRDEIISPDEFTVTGVFDLGYHEYNSTMIVTSLMNAQDLFEMGDSVNGLLVILDDPNYAHYAALDLNQQLGTNYHAKTWMESNSRYLEAVMVEKNVMFIILVFIMIVASFCIVCTQITFVVQKTREIGVLKSIGATNGQIMTLFFGQSFAVGAMGVLCGVGFGMTALHFRNDFLKVMRKFTGMELFPADVYGFYGLPAMIVPGDIILICGVSLVICLVASIVPAIKASQLQPVEALRHG